MAIKNSELEIEERAKRIRAAIAHLSCEKAELEASGWVLPSDCYVARYQARGQKYRYWYYQLKASQAVFPKNNKKGEYSRFKHLGKAGSQAHIDGVKAVIRRAKIEQLTVAIEGLYQSWLDLYPDDEKLGHRVD